MASNGYISDESVVRPRKRTRLNTYNKYCDDQAGLSGTDSGDESMSDSDGYESSFIDDRASDAMTVESSSDEDERVASAMGLPVSISLALRPGERALVLVTVNGEVKILKR